MGSVFGFDATTVLDPPVGVIIPTLEHMKIIMPVAYMWHSCRLLWFVLKKTKQNWHTVFFAVDLIHHTALTCGFSVGRQLEKSASSRNRGEVCLFYTTEND